MIDIVFCKITVVFVSACFAFHYTTHRFAPTCRSCVEGLPKLGVMMGIRLDILHGVTFIGKLIDADALVFCYINGNIGRFEGSGIDIFKECA